MVNINEDFEKLADELKNYKPKSLDLETMQARLNYADLNASSINLQTMILSIILVIFISIAFISHLTRQ